MGARTNSYEVSLTDKILISSGIPDLTSCAIKWLQLSDGQQEKPQEALLLHLAVIPYYRASSGNWIV